MWREQIEQQRSQARLVQDSRDVPVTRAVPATAAAVREHDHAPGLLRHGEMPRQPQRPGRHLDVLVDDMISTGGTIEAVVRVLLSHGAIPEITVVATHGLLVGVAVDRLGVLPLKRLLVTDTVSPDTGSPNTGSPNTGSPDTTAPLPLQVHSIAPLLADAIGRLHRDEPLDDLLIRS